MSLEIPDSELMILFQTWFRPMPRHVTSPIPVTTTRHLPGSCDMWRITWPGSFSLKYMQIVTYKRCAKKYFGFFLKSWRWLIWPTYSDRSRSIFFGSPWPSRTLLWIFLVVLRCRDHYSLWQKGPWWWWSIKKGWPRKVTVSRSNGHWTKTEEKIRKIFLQICLI